MAPDPQIECPSCCQRVGLNLSTLNGSPRINTHRDRTGDVCASSRVWVSKRMYDRAKEGL